MDEVDRIIDHAHRGRSTDDDLGVLVPAVEALRQVILEATPPPLRQYHAAYGEELEAIVVAMALAVS